MRGAILKKLGSLYTRVIMLAMGYIMIKEHRRNGIDFSKYPGIRIAAQKAPVIISNHTSFADILYMLYKYTPSFISSNHVQKMPVVGPIAQGLNCVFLDRQDAKSKETTLNAIVQKVQHISLTPQSTPLVIFPEGITGRGGFIKPFKRGAFFSLAPITPLYITYSAISYESSYYFFDLHDDLLLTLAEPYQMLTIQQLPTIAPNTEDYNEYCNEVYELYKCEFGLVPLRIDLKERDEFVQRLLYPWKNKIMA